MNKLIQIMPVVLATSVTMAGTPAKADEISPGDQVLIVAPSITAVYTSHAEGALVDNSEDSATVELERIDANSYNETEVGAILDSHSAGDSVTVHADYVEPYRENRVERIEAKAEVARMTDVTWGAPQYADPVQDHIDYIERLEEAMSERGLEPADLPEVAADIEVRERVVSQVQEEMGLEDVEAVYEEDPALWSRIVIDVAEEYGYMDYARALVLDDEIRHPVFDRDNRQVNLWQVNPETNTYRPAPTTAIDVAFAPFAGIAGAIHDGRKEHEGTKEVAGIAVDTFDGAHQEGSREEKIEALIEKMAELHEPYMR